MEPAKLYAAGERMRAIAEEFGEAQSGRFYAAFAELIHQVGLLCDWRAAVRSAGIDAQRFLTAAQIRAREWLSAYGEIPALGKMKSVAEQIVAISSIQDVPTMARGLASIPIPIGVYAQPKFDALSLRERMGSGKRKQPAGKPIDLAVAFVTFTIDGRPLADIHHVHPGEMHDIEIEVRVSRWPKGAIHLVLEPITVEATGTYELPTFTLESPHGEIGPFKMKSRGRVVLKVPQHFGARPFEFKYTARFSPTEVEQPVEVAGQRTLTLEGLDLARHPLTGYPAIDPVLLNVRTELRTRPHVPQQEIADLCTILVPLCNYAGQVTQDNLFNRVVSEKEFQQEVRGRLRYDPKIGAQLEEHPRATGGITDLSFRGIRIELKAETEKRLVLQDCTRYIGQAASYTVGSGKHVGILCVLDCSPKNRAPFPVQDGIGLHLVQEKDGSPVYIVIILIQGNLAKPSDLSH